VKWMRNTLCLLLLLAFSTVELFAQSTSSTTQVVTFGVRRIAMQAPSASYAANANVQAPLKVTTGSLSQVQSAVDFRNTTSEQTISSGDFAVNVGANNPSTTTATRETNFSDSRSPLTKKLPPGKLMVTYTE
jgi:hypothetical protein